ncbi:MAG: hypothetical protein HYU69_12160 [Bacteroidetes bacterium]|nr:hypothetical protein [Bacteroidota bacterium]
MIKNSLKKYYYYYQTKEEYYERKLFPKDIQYFNELSGQNNNLIRAKIKIEFRNAAWGCKDSVIKKILGKPRYILEKRHGNIIYSVLFHKEKISKYKVNIQTHFIDNVFFYACCTFSLLTKQEIHDFKNIIIEKYMAAKPKNENSGIDRHVLTDSNNNKIIIKDDVYFRICYLSGNKDLLRIIHKINKEETDSHNEHDKIKYDKLYNQL